MRILFVCLGNICRSPMAEAVMKKFLAEAGMLGSVEVDSAGLEAYHEGERADARMRAHGSRRGYDLQSISRPLWASDWDYFDMIICMDDQNVRSLEHRAPSDEARKKIQRATNFCDKFCLESNVPDPYYGGDAGFEYVIDLLEDACKGILNKILES